MLRFERQPSAKDMLNSTLFQGDAANELIACAICLLYAGWYPRTSQRDSQEASGEMAREGDARKERVGSAKALGSLMWLA